MELTCFVVEEATLKRGRRMGSVETVSWILVGIVARVLKNRYASTEQLVFYGDLMKLLSFTYEDTFNYYNNNTIL